MELGALEKLSAGDLTYRLTEDADRVSEVLYKSVHDTLPSVLQLFAVLGYMLWLDWKLTASILLLAPLIIWLISLFGARVMTATERSQKKVSELAGLLGEAIEGLPWCAPSLPSHGCKAASRRRSTSTGRRDTAPTAWWPCSTLL